jgi:D-tyrosyl-tRNA(Tyr) deacylase
MKVVVQRVASARISVDGTTVSEIGRGLLLLVGFGAGDEDAVLAPMAERVARLRIFPDDRGRFQHSVLEVDGAVLAVPNFTLYADTSRGRRPDFGGALEPAAARRLYDEFLNALRAAGIAKVVGGRFGAHMNVALENDGPVTILLESRTPDENPSQRAFGALAATRRARRRKDAEK